MLMGTISICALCGATMSPPAQAPVHAAMFAISASLASLCAYTRSSAYSHRLLFIKMVVTLSCFVLVGPGPIFCSWHYPCI